MVFHLKLLLANILNECQILFSIKKIKTLSPAAILIDLLRLNHSKFIQSSMHLFSLILLKYLKQALRLECVTDNYFCYFSTKIYSVGTQKNCHDETVLNRWIRK